MLIRLLALGQRPPPWVRDGFTEYARRLPDSCALELVELSAAPRRSGHSTGQLMADEAQRLRARLGKHTHVVALDERGTAWSSRELATKLDDWLHGGQDVDLLLGGADGLHPQLRAEADERWSLSSLTLPHMLVRVVVAEALYRAHSILQQHPYHRA